MRTSLMLACWLSAAIGAQSPLFSNLPYPAADAPDWSYFHQVLALGDFDGDGDLDFMSSTAFGVNDGTAKFDVGPAAAPTFPGLNTGDVVLALGDVDGDGDDELVRTVFPNASFVQIVGRGAAGAPTALGASLPALVNVERFARGDMDGDGDTDIVAFERQSISGVQNYLTTILQNQGGLVFTAWVASPMNPSFAGLAVGDFDADGDLDVLGNDATVVAGPRRRILRNDGGGVFAATPHFGGSAAPAYFVAADFTGDGLLDVAFGASPPSLSVGGFDEVLVNQGGGVFAAAPTTFASGPRGLAAFDLDGDGDAELLRAVRSGYFGAHQVTAGGVDATPTEFVDAIRYVGDLDGDADADVLGTDASGRLRLRLRVADGSLRESDGTPHGLGSNDSKPLSQFADLDGDGDLDAATAVVIADNVNAAWGSRALGWEVRLQTAPGSFVRSAAPDVPLLGGSAQGLVASHAADLDGDGTAELLAAGPLPDPATYLGGSPPSRLYVFKRASDGSFLRLDVDAAPGGPRRVETADLDGDGDLDVVVVAESGALPIGTTKTRRYLNLGGLAFAGADIGTPHFGADVAALDVDGDGDLDLVQANASSGTPATQPSTLFTNDGSGGFTESTFAPAFNAPSVRAVDVDLDGDVDLVGGGQTILRTPTGFVAIPPSYFPIAIANSSVADVTGDGLPDLVANGGYAVGLGAAGFGPWNWAFPLHSAPSSFSTNNRVEAVDLDGDGDRDLADRFGRIHWNLTRHLSVGLVPDVGGAARLDVRGTAGEPVALFGATATITPTPLGPYGVLHLDPTYAFEAATVVCDAGGLAAFSTTIPAIPGLVGFTLHFQGFHALQGKLGTLRTVVLDDY